LVWGVVLLWYFSDLLWRGGRTRPLH
jgi:hypothetical protein